MTPEPTAICFEKELDRSPITPIMWLIWMLSAGLIGLDGFDFFIIGVAMPFIEKDFGFSASQAGAIAVAAVAGSLVGSLTLGAITDRVGRDIMLIVDIILFLIASLGTALAWNTVSLITFRFLVGVAIGADYPISVSYITENVPAKYRGRMVIGAFSFQALGTLLGALVGLGIIISFQHYFPDNLDPIIHYAWRCMLGVGLLLAVAIGLLRLQFLIESPRYYIAKGNYEAATEAASLLLGEKVLITPEDNPPETVATHGYLTLFSPHYLRATFLASIPWFLQDISTYGLGIFTPVIIASLALTNAESLSSVAVVSAQGSAFVDIFLILGFIGAILLIDWVGRIKLQIIGFFGMAFGLILLSFSNGEISGNHPNLILLFSGFMIFNLLMNLGPNSTTFLLSGEVFPTSVRATGAGFAAAFAKLGAVFGTFILPIFKENWGISPLLWFLAAASILAAIITYIFRIETTGRPLEEVETE